jgi:hypothetical protein
MAVAITCDGVVANGPKTWHEAGERVVLRRSPRSAPQLGSGLDPSAKVPRAIEIGECLFDDLLATVLPGPSA